MSVEKISFVFWCAVGAVYLVSLLWFLFGWGY
jgi:hypothetical protein